VLDAYKNGSIDATTLYLIIGIGFGILFAAPVILCGIFVRERVEIPKERVRLNLGELVEPLKIRPFRHLVGMYIGQAICMDVFSAGVVMFAGYVTTPKGSSTVFLGIFIAVQLLAFPIVNKLIRTVDVSKIYRFGLPLSVAALVAFAVFGSNLYAAYACVFFVALGFAGAQLTSWIMFPHAVDAGELLTGKRQSGGCSAIMTFVRKSSSALVLFIFSNVLELTGYDANLAVQPISAQNGIKYVMAFTCIIFMLVGFVMAKKYVLTHERKAQVEKFLKLRREGGIETLSDGEREEYLELTKLIS
jgi:GPH family glycoside/pentoside/hexuronide:cation symporter/oligogalacturonide transporter